MDELHVQDPEIFDAIEREVTRQNDGIELIASENFVSKAVMQAMGSPLTNKYAEGLPGKRYYSGCQFVDEAEDLARERAKKLFGGEWVNVQPHSGAQANAAIYLTLLKPGDTFLGLDLSHGGHLTHGSRVNFSGILYHAEYYGVEKDGSMAGRIDMDPEQFMRSGSYQLLRAGIEARRRVLDERGDYPYMLTPLEIPPE